MIIPTIFIAQVILLFFLSRQTTKELFYSLRIFIKNEKMVFSFVSLVYFPGTILHEMAHFFLAMVLMLKVREVKVFPEWEKNYIKLGSVVYEKKDFLRGIVVGIAPFFIGLFFFWTLAYFKIFPHQNFIINLVLGYLIFTISSTMFSSKQDLKDLIYILPLLIVILGIIFIFNIKLNFVLENRNLINVLASIINKINYYLFFSLMINSILVILLRLFKSFKKI